jgi:hypothetical protein
MMLQPNLLAFFSGFGRLQLVAMLNAFLIGHQLAAINRGIRSKGSRRSHQTQRDSGQRNFHGVLGHFSLPNDLCINAMNYLRSNWRGAFPSRHFSYSPYDREIRLSNKKLQLVQGE